MSESVRLLLIEDDLLLAETTAQYLQNYGFSVEHQEDGLKGLKAIGESKPDLVLLDLMLPSLDGLEICRRVRQDPLIQSTPILMLTARGDEMDRVVGLEMGADDYLAKPYSLREMVARIRAILRRLPSPEVSKGSSESKTEQNKQVGEQKISFLELTIDWNSRSCVRFGKSIILTATEFVILWVFASNPGQVFSRDQLLDKARGRDFEVFDRSIDMHISKLRKKLEEDPRRPSLIKTVWGVGYQFHAPSLNE